MKPKPRVRKVQATGRPHRGRSRATLGWFLIAGAAAVAASFAIPAVRRAAGLEQPAGPPLNILLVTLDTVRADRIGAYGYAPARTSHFDRLAAEGVRFERVIAPAPITLPSHASLFTARFPFAHGVRNNGNFYLGGDQPTLATALHDRGYRTAAFVSSFILDRRYGLARGFDEYDDRLESGRKQVVNLEVERRGDITALKAAAWLEQYARENRSAGSDSTASSQSAAVHPFFVWLHLYDPHEPYRPPPPFRELFADRPYDGEIAFTDTILASVMDRLDKLGLLQSTLIAVVADHGESLGDHGEETHSMFVYESAVRVPLILWRPGRLPAGRVIQPLVRVVDLAPTLLDIVGAPPLPATQGRSLVPLVDGRSLPAEPAYSETYLPLFYMNWSPLRALSDDRWTYIDAPKPELYDRSRDPQEGENIAARDPALAARMAAALTRFTGGGAGTMTASRVDRETLDKLASLGYVASAADPPSVSAGDTSRPDPKDMIAVFNRLRTANSAVRDGRFAEAVAVAGKVLDEDPRNAFARIIVASAQLNQGAYRDAIAGYRAYLELVPTSAYAHHWIAICYVRLGDRAKALQEEEAALAIDPNYADARVLRGGVLAALGRFDDAIGELTKAVATDPEKAGLRLDLAKILVDARRVDEAEMQYRRALELAPNNADVHTGYGVLLAGRQQLDEAVAEFQRALAINPLHYEARFDLARVLEQQGKADAARIEYERIAAAEEAGPVRQAARQRLAARGR